MNAIAETMTEARAALRGGHAEKALLLADRVLASRPGSVGALTLRGNCLIELERLCEARCAFETLNNVAPDRPDAYRGLARVAEKAEQWPDALVNWRRFAAASPQGVEPRLRLAKSALRMGEPEEALQAAEDVLKVEPGHMEAALTCAKALSLLGRLDDAEARYHSTLEMHPKANAALLGLANFAAQTRRWGLFKETMKAVRVGDEKDPRVLRRFLPILANSGLFDEAIAVARRIRTLVPSDHVTWLREHWLLARLGDQEAQEAVVAEARAALSATPAELAHYLDGLGCFREAGALRSWIAASGAVQDLRALTESYRKLGRLDALHQLLRAGRNCPASERQASWFDDVCRRTATNPDRLADQVAEARPLTLALRVVERLVELSRDAATPNGPVRRVAFCNGNFRGIGGSQRSTLLALKALTEPRCPFERLVLITEEASRVTGSDVGLQHLLDEIEVEVMPVVASNSIENAVGTEADPAWCAAWLDLLALLPDDLRRNVLGSYNRLRSLRPDAAIVWDVGSRVLLPMGLAALMAKVPRIIVSARGIGEFDAGQPGSISDTPLHAATERAYLSAFLSLPQVSFMACSSYLRDAYARLLSTSLSEASVVRNAIVESFVSVSDRDRPGDSALQLSAKQKVVGGVLRLSLIKQPFLWIEVARLVRRRLGAQAVHFVLVGDGHLSPGLQEAVRKAGLEDCLTLVGETADVASWLERMDLLLQTSLSEGCPNSVIEAEFCGVPVVTTDCGSAHEVMRQGETGWVVHSMEAEVIAERVCWCLTHEDWLEKASKKARSFAREDLSLSRMRAGLLQMLEPEATGDRKKDEVLQLA